jgi:DNA-binding transcriptional regulator YhcF (GntR family)
MTQVESERTSLPDAVKLVLKLLQHRDRKEEPLTIQEIAKQSGLNPRTVSKVIEILEEAYDVFSKEDLVVLKTSAGTLVEVEPKQTSLLNLPEDVQKMLIRTKYFPQPSREQETLVHLLLKGAVNQHSAVYLEKTQLVAQLLEMENIASMAKTTQSGGELYYLTEIGRMVAEGTLEIYPELKTV